MPTNDDRGSRSLEIEVEAELVVAQSSEPGEAPMLPESEWLFDPTEVEREEIGLRNLLGAVEVLEGDPGPPPALLRSPDPDRERPLS